MTEYVCAGCNKPITDGYVIVSQGNWQRKGGKPDVTIHGSDAAGQPNLVQQQADPSSCLWKYILKGDELFSDIIPFTDLEKTAQREG